MKTCEWCGIEFDPDEAEDMFIDEFPQLSYRNLTKCLCGNCAITAIEDQDDDVYIEECESCGARFDLFEACREFESEFSGDLLDQWDDGILCAECAIRKVEEKIEEQERYS